MTRHCAHKTDDGNEDVERFDDDEYVVVDDQCSHGANATDDEDEGWLSSSWDIDFDPTYEDGFSELQW